jgi:hypothetical protein
MLQAMNTGHDGSLGTIHANSPRDALARLETMVLMAGIELPSRAIREQIAAALDLLVHIERFEDGVRRIASVAKPGARLRVLLEQWHAERAPDVSCASGGRRYPFVDCGRIQAAIERLALEFPSDPSILLANAVIAYQTEQSEKAASYLDALLAAEPDPGAAVLRSRIAIQQGNLPHARRLLEQQVHRAPDESDLRERSPRRTT